jgi:hypothetical protein
MSIKSRKKHDIIKVKGVTRYCHLNAPNKKFEPEYGAYTCDLVVDKDQAEMIKNTLRPLYEEELKTVQEENPNKKKIMQRDFPIEESEDGIVVKSKLKAGGRRKDGSEYKLSIALYDAQGKPLPEDVQVWGGSKVNLAFRPKFYYVPSLGFGVSFELQAVQVLELKNGGVNGPSAEAFGFTSEEGYVANGGETLDQVFDAEEDNSEEITANF